MQPKNENNSIVIAIDAMGGDFGPDVTVPAALQVLARHKNLKLILVGDSTLLNEKVAAYSAKCKTQKPNTEHLIVKHASEVVKMDESPAKSLRTKKDSSMRVAINLVKDSAAQACVSAGNTGALMATAHFVLKTLPGIDRSAIASTFPTVVPGKEVRILDLGANVDSDASHLYQFAIMGSVLSQTLDNIEHPKVALLNVGAEEIKGNEQVKNTAQLLSQNKKINYIGYIEGDAMFKGEVDVVVCDGFTGNIALKAIEGIVKLITVYLKKAFTRNILTKFVAFLALPILKSFAKELDPGRRNGATFLGLRGIVIKSHGGANINAFTSAIEEAILEAKTNVLQKISNEISRLLEK